ncbi:FecR family protein [Pedobacter sp. ASV28]|uniref:FecR family protein n=1 Tax=Pedobacter sp. ASV28 TaxID=2795123 RepID=UPI0018EC4B2D|nr:FecR domain-containing protein [Pedobacter sp. ASV28]
MQQDNTFSETRLLYLLQAYMAGHLTQDEKAELEKWVDASADNKLLLDQIADPAFCESALQNQRSYDVDSALHRVKKQTGRSAAQRLLWFRYTAIAAAVILICTVGSLFYRQRQPAEPLEQISYVDHDIAPGKHGATLRLANGRSINLNETNTGTFAKEAGVTISKTASGQLVYTATQSRANTGLNTLSTAKGETYQVNLPDGSSIWLNAYSSVTYLANFAQQKERHVKLEGEAYFEVAKDKTRPFIVETREQKVRVLGTHFNISSYADEQFIRTTLLEGMVRVSNDHNSAVVLAPGQQTINHNGRLTVSETDAFAEADWRSGRFNFRNEKIESIMRKLGRWYNIEVLYDGVLPEAEFNGRISRNKNISQVLDVLEKTQDVHFKIEGRRVTVSK